MRPTPKAVACFALSVPVALLLVVCLPEYWYAAFYLPAAALACLAADAVMAVPENRLRVESHCPLRLSVGQIGMVKVLITPDARTTSRSGGLTESVGIEALLEQEGDADPPAGVRGSLEPAVGSLALSLPVTPRRRGRLAIRALWLRRQGPLGLVELRRRLVMDQRIDVVPDIRGIHEEALLFFARDAAYGVKTQRLKGEGTEFETLREYAQGMDSRFIDWKRSARHRKLLCKEFRQERNHQIVLCFDTGHLMLEPVLGVPKLDHAIRSALLLAWVSLRNGDQVGGCGFDLKLRHFLKPERGMPWFSRFQGFTAGLDYSTEETNFTLGLSELNARLQRRALVILFTDFVDSISAELMLESLRWTTQKHLVVFVTLRDPFLASLANAPPADFIQAAKAVIADDFQRERAVVLEKISRLGAYCLDVPARELSTQLLNRYLMIKQRGLL